jgi:hypothetical protein
LDRTRCDFCRSAFRFAAASIGSFDDGVPEFEEFIPNRRSNSAIRTACALITPACSATSAASTSYEVNGCSDGDTPP